MLGEQPRHSDSQCSRNLLNFVVTEVALPCFDPSNCRAIQIEFVVTGLSQVRTQPCGSHAGRSAAWRKAAMPSTRGNPSPLSETTAVHRLESDPSEVARRTAETGHGRAHASRSLRTIGDFATNIACPRTRDLRTNRSQASGAYPARSGSSGGDAFEGDSAGPSGIS